MPSASIGRKTLHYEDTGGGGPAVVFLHAFPLNSKMWAPQIEALSGRYRCIAPDLTGFGASEAPDDVSAYSIESWADDVKALLDHLGLDRVVLVGLSMGGYVALAFARRHASALSALVLADTRAEADAPEVKEKRSKQQEMVRSHGTAPVIEGLIDALASDVTREKKPDVVDKMRELMANPAQGFVGALEAMKKRPDSTEALSRITVATLIVVGERDSVTPPEAARKLHEHIGGSSLVVVPDAGHLANLEVPEAFNGALADFLASL